MFHPTPTIPCQLFTCAFSRTNYRRRSVHQAINPPHPRAAPRKITSHESHTACGFDGRLLNRWHFFQGRFKHSSTTARAKCPTTRYSLFLFHIYTALALAIAAASTLEPVPACHTVSAQPAIDAFLASHSSPHPLLLFAASHPPDFRPFSWSMLWRSSQLSPLWKCGHTPASPDAMYLHQATDVTAETTSRMKTK